MVGEGTRIADFKFWSLNIKSWQPLGLLTIVKLLTLRVSYHLYKSILYGERAKSGAVI